jgi:inosine/xanthosine triphosphatase
MRLNLGSNNPLKLQAVQAEFPQAQIVAHDVPSGVASQPMTLEETILGAKNRAKAAFGDCKYSVGIESGLMPAAVRTGYLNVCVCAIYDGKEFYVGMSPGFEHKSEVIDLVKSGHEVSTAYQQLNNTKELIGYGKGAISDLTNGAMDRAEYTRLGVMMAKIHLPRN